MRHILITQDFEHERVGTVEDLIDWVLNLEHKGEHATVYAVKLINIRPGKTVGVVKITLPYYYKPVGHVTGETFVTLDDLNNRLVYKDEVLDALDTSLYNELLDRLMLKKAYQDAEESG